MVDQLQFGQKAAWRPATSILGTFEAKLGAGPGKLQLNLILKTSCMHVNNLYI